jgi:raffinose/stachyose/melibiose transport system permease protein
VASFIGPFGENARETVAEETPMSFASSLEEVIRSFTQFVALAKVEGAGPIRRFLYVTFPLLRETTLIVLAITAINALKAYDIVYAMTNGGPANQTQLLSTWMYFLAYNYNQVGLGTAIAVILFSLTMIFAIPYMRFMTRKT